MTPRPALRSAHRALICLVLAALSLAQVLGMMHRVLHAAHAPYGAHAAPVQVVAPAVDERRHAQRLAALFDGHEEGQADCRLFDQISHADLAGLELPVFEAAPLHGTRPVVYAAWHVAARPACFQARGPPAQA